MDATTSLLVVSLGITLLFAAPGVAQEPAASLPKADEVLDKADAKTGDVAARKAMRSLLMKGSFVTPDMPGKAGMTVAFLGTDRALRTIKVGGIGTCTEGTTGTLSWSTDPVLGVFVREGAEQLSVVRQFGISRRADWRSMYARAVVVGKPVIEGKPNFEIEMYPKTGAPDRWFIDAADYTFTRADLKLPHPNQGELAASVYNSDWRKAGDIMFPFSVRIRIAEFDMTVTYESITPNAEVTEEMVGPPENVKQAIADPSKRAKPLPDKGGQCAIETIKPQPVASIRLTVKEADMSKTLAVVFPEIFAHMEKAGGQLAAPPFTRYHKIDGDSIDLEAGIPLKAPITPGGRVIASELPGGKVAVNWHLGNYDKLPESHKVLEEWMKKNGYKSGGAFWEVYWTDPGIESDSSKWRTQILWPVEQASSR